MIKTRRKFRPIPNEKELVKRKLERYSVEPKKSQIKISTIIFDMLD